jgi:hypothetical protein
VEWEEARSGARYVLDAELLRVRLTARRDISASRFLTFGLDLNGVFNGFADGAFNWYHSAIGINFRGREQRPQNEFLYSVRLPKGNTVQRERPDYFLGDLEVGYGLRHGLRNQTLFLATLPTGTAPEGYTKDTWSLSAIHTWRALRTGRVLVEGTVGAGYTPATGALEEVQVEFFNSTSAVLALRLFGTTSFYSQVFTQNALYDDTTLPELETREWSGDFGFFGRTASGRQWRVGLTEDFGPKDAGIDLVLRFAISW